MNGMQHAPLATASRSKKLQQAEDLTGRVSGLSDSSASWQVKMSTKAGQLQDYGWTGQVGHVQPAEISSNAE
jgi:hypothetical protein